MKWRRSSYYGSEESMDFEDMDLGEYYNYGNETLWLAYEVPSRDFGKILEALEFWAKSYSKNSNRPLKAACS